MNNADSSALTTTTGTGLAPAEAEFIPFQQHAEWMKLAIEEMSRVKELLRTMAEIKEHPKGVLAACYEIAQRNKGRRGWSKGNLKTLYYGWIGAEQDWRALTRGYNHESALPVEFTQYLCAMVLREHRSRKQAIERVRREWRSGERIPGYGTWREWFAATYPDREVPVHFAGDYPTGWSDTNLREQMPSRAQADYATKGLVAAQKHLPHLIRDTSKLRRLELVVFDDFKTDIRVAAYNPVLKKWEVVPCAGLLAMDVATRKILTFALLPRFTLPRRAVRDDQSPITAEEMADDERMRQINITRSDMQKVIKIIFQDYGIPNGYPMTLLVENAAAAITEGLESALEIYFHGQVRVCRTNMLDARTPANGFTERGGKPWEKGWIESAFNVMHNIAGNLPGQTGSLEQKNAPGDLPARIAYTLATLDGVAPEQAANIKLPVLKEEQAFAAYSHIFDLMDQRGEHAPHKMIGFDKLQLCRRGPGEPWQPINTLALTAADDSSAIEVVERVQSPRERWAALAKQEKPFIKVPDFVTALLAFTPVTKLKIRNHKVTFSHQGFAGTYLDLEGQLKHLAEGTKVVGYFDEQKPTHLYVTDLQGRPLAALQRQPDKTNLANAEEISAAQAIMARFFHGQIGGPVNEALADDRAKQLADDQHNAAERARLGLPEISSSVRPSASRATHAPSGVALKQGDNGDTAAKPGPRRLSSTLARDAFAKPADQFGAAAATAAGIGQASTQQAAATARSQELRQIGDATGELLSETPAAEAPRSAPASALQETDPDDSLL